MINQQKVGDLQIDKLQAVKTFLLEEVLIENNIDYNLHKYLPNINWTSLFKKLILENPVDIKYYLCSIPIRIRHLYYDFFPYQFLLNSGIINTMPTTSSKYEYKRLKKSPEFFSIHMNNFRTLVK